MAEDKKEMPADGSGTERHETDANGEVASRRDADAGGLPNSGESGGGAYQAPKAADEDFHGGQSRQGYYGKGQLGDQDVGDNENAVSTDE